MDAFDFSALIAVIGVLVGLTNIITEVLKKALWDKLPTNLLALIIAEVLTLGAGGALASIKHISIAWYMVLAAVVVGFAVAYAAMFGFDKLKEIIEGWGHE